MNKKQSHAILLFFDLLCIGIFWFGYNEFQLTLSEITNHPDVIRFSNRAGFFIVTIGAPLIHLLPVIDYFWPEFPKKYSSMVNKGIIVLVIALIAAGFVGSSWLKSQTENAGYVYCRNASGISALAKTLVYTKDMKICDDLVASKRQARR